MAKNCKATGRASTARVTAAFKRIMIEQELAYEPCLLKTVMSLMPKELRTKEAKEIVLKQLGGMKERMKYLKLRAKELSDEPRLYYDGGGFRVYLDPKDRLFPYELRTLWKGREAYEDKFRELHMAIMYAQSHYCDRKSNHGKALKPPRSIRTK